MDIECERKIIPATIEDIAKLVDGTKYVGTVWQDNLYFDRIPNYPLLEKRSWFRQRIEKDWHGKETVEWELKVPHDGNTESMTTHDEFSSLRGEIREIISRLRLNEHDKISENILRIYGYIAFIHFKTVRHKYSFESSSQLTLCVDKTVGMERRPDNERFVWEVVEVEKVVRSEIELPIARQAIDDFLKEKKDAGVVFREAKGGKATNYLKFYKPELYKVFCL